MHSSRPTTESTACCRIGKITRTKLTLEHKTKSVVTDEHFYIYFTEISASKSQMAEELALEASMNEEELERITEQARDRVEQQEAKNLALFAQCQTQKLKLGKASRENSELKGVCERFSAVRSQSKQYRYLPASKAAACS